MKQLERQKLYGLFLVGPFVKVMTCGRLAEDG